MSTPATLGLGLNLPLLRPVLGLVGWTYVIEAWMYSVRIPAMDKARKAGANMGPESTTAEMNAQVPRRVTWKADNYNHLHEAPTRFYAIGLGLSIIQLANPTLDLSLETKLAWAYVGLRAVHSLVQTTSNVQPARFLIYFSSQVVMFGLFARGAALLW